MPTDAENQATNDEAVTFDEKQQAKLDEIVRKATARAGAEARAEAERLRTASQETATKLADAEAKLEKATKAKKAGEQGEDVDALKAQISEMKSAGQQTLQQLEEAKRAIASKDKEVLSAKEETLSLKKNVFIKDSALKANFVDAKQVYKLTADNIKYDDGTGSFVVVGDDGQPRLNSAYDPMTPEQFYAEYAAKNPWLVKGDVKPGAGSTSSNKFDGGVTKFKVEDVFGKKSSSKLANDLFKADPVAYRKLKAEAQSAGLIA